MDAYMFNAELLYRCPDNADHDETNLKSAPGKCECGATLERLEAKAAKGERPCPYAGCDEPGEHIHP